MKVYSLSSSLSRGGGDVVVRFHCGPLIRSRFVIPDFPEDAKWLSKEEAAFVKARLAADQGDSARDRHTTGRDVLNCFKDYKGMSVSGALDLPSCGS